MTTDEPSTQPGSGPTSFHVRRAIDGDRDSLAWLIERLSPLLAMQANYRLPARLRHIADPDDIVADVWLAVLPKLGTLGANPGRWTPLLVRYLSTSVLRRVNELHRKHLLNKPAQGPLGDEADHGDPAFRAALTGAVTHALRAETQAAVHAAIASLDPSEREIVVLRGIEQIGNRHAAELLGETPGALAMRYHRALTRLRARIPNSVFDEIADETERSP